MKQKFQKQLFTFVIVITGSSSLLLGAFPQVASAGRLVRECNQMASPTNSTRSGRASARISCYATKMREIILKKEDLKRLDKTIVAIRGAKNQGTSKKHQCVVGVIPNLRLLYGSKSSETTYDVRFSVRDGMCSRYWNRGVESANEYYRLYCHVGLSSYNVDVKRLSKEAIKSNRQYSKCFNDSIPAIIKRDYPITSYASFKDYYTRLLNHWKINQMPQEYEDLAKSCNRTLEGLRREDPSFVRNHNPSCQ